MKLLKKNFRVILDENETYESIVDIILQKKGIKTYKKYIDSIFIEREIDRDMIKVRKKEIDKKFFIKLDNDLIKNCNCLRCIIQGEICDNHKCI